MKEIRAIIFTEDEVRLALAEHRARRGASLDGKILVLNMAGSPVSAAVEFIDRMGLNRRVTFSDIEIGAALVAFCIARKVPLPARAEKQVELLSNGLALMISIPDSASILPAVRARVTRRGES